MKSNVLEERAKLLAMPLNETAERVLNLITFPVGDELYGVPMELLREIQPLKKQNWSRVPLTPDFILGAVNIRGRIRSIMDIARFLGLPPRPLSETAHILLARGPGRNAMQPMEFCILGDDVPKVANVPLEEVQTGRTAVSDKARKFIRGVTGNMLMILDLERLLSDPEIIVQVE